MEEKVLFQYVFLIFGVANLVWGLLLVSSEQFFEFWQNRFWKQKRDEHLLEKNVLYNRYTRGVTSIAIGLAIVYLMFYRF